MAHEYFQYRGEKTRTISFPLGGIGSGSIGLGGDGRLIDWEIFNHPDKGSRNGMSHFALRVEDPQSGECVDARILNGPLRDSLMGSYRRDGYYRNFGFGPARETLAGVPHFADVVFEGTYPTASLAFTHPSCPVEVSLTAFNPFIPLNDRDSSIPAAFFSFQLQNPTQKTLRCALAGTLHNPLPEENVHRYFRDGLAKGLALRSNALAPDGFDQGELAIATDAPEVSYQEYWFRGSWFDALEVYWHDLRLPGHLPPRRYEIGSAGKENHATLAAHLELKPGERKEVRFVISWHFPDVRNDWNAEAAAAAEERGILNRWRNYYASLFLNAQHSAVYSLNEWNRLFNETCQFRDALFRSDLPSEAIDAISANISILKTTTVKRLEDGSFYGFEGCHADSGCCEGSCTHVWNYTQALPFLFPRLERSMRDLNFRYNQNQAGALRFRLQLPLGLDADHYWPFRACADGQFGDVMKAYRDWKICGDLEWLRGHWQAIRAAVEYAWSDQNPDRWDPDQTGVLWGRQHHTLDMELFGPNAWLTGFYLGALKAASEMAQALGEEADAARYRSIFTRGKAWLNQHLFNGEYYSQIVDLNDREQLLQYEGALDSYWDEEHQQIKYQIGGGIGIDQMAAQWHANLYGLGEIFDRSQARTALKSLFRYNFKPALGEQFNPCRLFGVEEESGLVICSWKDDASKPIIPIPYSEEVMTGFEYAAAAHMIQEGLVEEGMRVVKAIRARYDGEKRNPWNEFECGSNYSRAMASYALLISFSGFQFDRANGLLGFEPVTDARPFSCFWSIVGAWGTVRLSVEEARLSVLGGGGYPLRQLVLPGDAKRRFLAVECGGEGLAAREEDGAILFEEPLILRAGARVIVRFEAG
ncbi:MAG: hypothetical protein JW750_03370 [Anaerolineaceae bacterium]|nr:hypothetical protein [Anaerolineaceae bacterium]